MNLATLNLIIGTIAGVIAILVYLWKGVRFNKARNKAQHGRTTSLAEVAIFQNQRISAIEKHLVATSNFQPSEGLTTLEEKALSEYESHHTNLT
jgi:hypothetical protein